MYTDFHQIHVSVSEFKKELSLRALIFYMKYQLLLDTVVF